MLILEEVLSGVSKEAREAKVVVDPDRHAAIRRALDDARDGDVVVIAGKGHETYQEVAGTRLPFDDAVEARQALSARFGSDPETWVSTLASGHASTES
jgi:UDP-N-acetylmuramoyl-L-alanyl-D-glutamate--2,6-diaminopimelate ligase